MKEFNITLNGNSVTGYPVRIEDGMPMWPYKKFVDVTGRFMNNDCGQQLSLSDFKYNWLYAHKFEGEETSSGWIGFNMQLTKAFNVPHSLGNCIIMRHYINIIIFIGKKITVIIVLVEDTFLYVSFSVFFQTIPRSH